MTELFRLLVFMLAFLVPMEPEPVSAPTPPSCGCGHVETPTGFHQLSTDEPNVFAQPIGLITPLEPLE